jgi:hypothetical protein
LSGLFDFFQSASNTVADNVAGPVDLINAGLGLFGLRSKEPVGGSEWMKRWGLKRDVEMGGARLAGETAGLLSPALLAAKAPQIAKGLLAAQENAAIPRQMHPEMGAIVYHGSPHTFDKFDASKIGTGEGAQAYGHGLYFADNPQIASGYYKALSDNPGIKNMRLGSLSVGPHNNFNYSRRASENSVENIRASLAEDLLINENELYALNKSGFTDHVLKTLDDKIAGYKVSGDAEMVKAGDQLKRMLKASGVSIDFHPAAGGVYKVDLPDEAIAKMLDWDKPLSQQAPEVRKLIEASAARAETGSLADEAAGYALMPNRFPPNAKEATGESIYRAMREFAGQGADPATYLRQQGIPGIRYLDGGSRGAGTGTSNYVVFPGEEHLLKILERNGGLMGP